MDIQRGMRDKLDKYFKIEQEIEIYIDVTGSDRYHYCCLGVDGNGKLSDDRYMIFDNQPQSPNSEVLFSSHESGAKFLVNLNKLPQSIKKLVFTVIIDGNSTMEQITAHKIEIRQGNSSIRMVLSGSDFRQEKAIVSMELYQKDVWRFAAVASGFHGGFKELLRSFGYEKMVELKSNAPMPSPAAPQKKVELRKGQKVNLFKQGASLGEVLINLNWSQPKRKGFFSPRPQAIDLDLGCLFELQDGTKGCVQALGNAFGSLTNPPYIALDGDDRSGATVGGENLRVNGKMISRIRRILVYTFIYEGAANWREADGVVTVKCPGSQEIIVRMDEYGSSLTMCAIALLENCNNETFSVEKIVRFFYGHRFMDEAFHWGLNWISGRK